jgi:hypothetical protein
MTNVTPAQFEFAVPNTLEAVRLWPAIARLAPNSTPETLSCA